MLLEYSFDSPHGFFNSRKDKFCPLHNVYYFWTKLVLMKSNDAIISIGEHIRSLREMQNLSLKEVSSQIGIDSSLLGKIERDTRKPTSEQLVQLSIFFNLDENLLIRQNLSDQLAYQVIHANADVDILKVAERKIEYLKKRNK